MNKPKYLSTEQISVILKEIMEDLRNGRELK